MVWPLINGIGMFNNGSSGLAIEGVIVTNRWATGGFGCGYMYAT